LKIRIYSPRVSIELVSGWVGQYISGYGY